MGDAMLCANLLLNFMEFDLCVESLNGITENLFSFQRNPDDSPFVCRLSFTPAISHSLFSF